MQTVRSAWHTHTHTHDTASAGLFIFRQRDDVKNPPGNQEFKARAAD